MKIKVLGCYGGEMPGHRTTCFMLNSQVLIDAGAITAAIPINDQAKIEAIFLSHSHLDHVRDIGFLADNIFGMRDKPVRIYGFADTIRDLRTHILNDAVWPDFSKLPTPENPVISYHEIEENVPFEFGNLTVTAIKVNHIVTSAGYIVNNTKVAVALSGDTGPTEAFWKAAAGVENLRAIFLETSFPDRLSDLAETTGHLTPASAQKELEKLGRPEIQVYIYHMKPQYMKEITSEFDVMDKKFYALHQGDLIEI